MIKVLLYLASHTETYMIHNVKAAEALGVGRNTFANWVTLAEATPHLVKCETGRRDSHGNAESVLHVSLRGFTEAEQEDITQRALRPCTGVHSIGALEKPMSLEAHSGTPPAELVTYIALPDKWAPNHTHRMSARNLGLDPDDLQEIAGEFREWAEERDLRRRDLDTWDRAFGAFLNAQVNGDVDHYFPGSEQLAL